LLDIGLETCVQALGRHDQASFDIFHLVPFESPFLPCLPLLKHLTLPCLGALDLALLPFVRALDLALFAPAGALNLALFALVGSLHGVLLLAQHCSSTLVAGCFIKPLKLLRECTSYSAIVITASTAKVHQFQHQTAES